jgi:hypothetical protein
LKQENCGRIVNRLPGDEDVPTPIAPAIAQFSAIDARRPNGSEIDEQKKRPTTWPRLSQMTGPDASARVMRRGILFPSRAAAPDPRQALAKIAFPTKATRMKDAMSDFFSNA